MSDDLGAICRLLSERIDDHQARVSVAVETGPDEAMLVGTADGYLRLALAFIEFVRKTRADEAKRISLDGIMIPNAWFGDVCAGGEIRITSGWLAGDAEEQKRIEDFFLWLSPPSPPTPP